MSPQASETKAKINGTTSNFSTAKEAINKMKRQSTEWEKTFTNDNPTRG